MPSHKHKDPVVTLTGDTKPKKNRFTKDVDPFKGKFLVPADLGGTKTRDERTDIVSFDQFRGFTDYSFPCGFGSGNRSLSDIPGS